MLYFKWRFSRRTGEKKLVQYKPASQTKKLTWRFKDHYIDSIGRRIWYKKLSPTVMLFFKRMMPIVSYYKRHFCWRYFYLPFRKRLINVVITLITIQRKQVYIFRRLKNISYKYLLINFI